MALSELTFEDLLQDNKVQSVNSRHRREVEYSSMRTTYLSKEAKEFMRVRQTCLASLNEGDVSLLTMNGQACIWLATEVLGMRCGNAVQVFATSTLCKLCQGGNKSEEVWCCFRMSKVRDQQWQIMLTSLVGTQ